MSGPAQPPSSPPPSGAAPPPPASAAPPHDSPVDEAAKEVAKVTSMIGSMSGSDTLIMGGAALFVIVGDLIFGAALGGITSSYVFNLGGATLAGVLAAEVIFFAWLMKPAAGRVVSVAPATATAIVAALVTAIFVLTLGEFILILRNFGELTDNGIAFLLYELSHWAGAVLMALGVFAMWGPAPKK